VPSNNLATGPAAGWSTGIGAVQFSGNEKLVSPNASSKISRRTTIVPTPAKRYRCQNLDETERCAHTQNQIMVLSVYALVGVASRLEKYVAPEHRHTRSNKVTCAMRRKVIFKRGRCQGCFDNRRQFCFLPKLQ
jgi:hypothetical protein